MRSLFAQIDENGYVINVGFSPKEFEIKETTFRSKLYNKKENNTIIKIDLTPKKDIFYEEDVLFIEEFLYEVLEVKELAERFNVTVRQMFRRLKKTTTYKKRRRVTDGDK